MELLFDKGGLYLTRVKILITLYFDIKILELLKKGILIYDSLSGVLILKRGLNKNEETSWYQKQV